MISHCGIFGRSPIAAVLVAACVGNVLGAETEQLAGHWRGAINIGGATLDIHVDLEHAAGAWSGRISIPAQDAKDLSLADVTVNGATISFRIADIPGIAGSPFFQGQLTAGDRIAGGFSQHGHDLTFELARSHGSADKARAALADFDSFAEQALRDWNVPGLAIGVVVDDQVVYAKGFGKRDIQKDLPVTTQTLFAIGSATKAFTTFTMGALVDDGKLDWNKPVLTYLPHFQLWDDYATTHISPRDLVTHRSGLPRHDLAWYNNQALSRREMVDRLRFFEPSKQLRETYQYNNLMFLTAGFLIENITGVTWEDAVKSRVLEPLGMKRTNFSVRQSQADADHAAPYEERDDQLRPMAFRDIDNVGPAGSINSCIDDMVKWLSIQLGDGQFAGKRIISENALREMHTPQTAIASLPEEPELSPASYALGWFIRSYRGHLQVDHGGAIDGFIAAVTLFPADGVGIVVFANKNGSSLPVLMTRHAADRVLGLSPKDWNGEALDKWQASKLAAKKAEEQKDLTRKKNTRPTYPLEEYVSEYEHPGYGLVRITFDGERLAMTFNNIETPLEHWHYDVFSGLENPADATFENMRIQFLSNLKGDIDRIEIPLEPLLHSIVFTRNPDPRLSDPVYLQQFVGTYELAKEQITVGLQGSTLTLRVPGQPVHELAPDHNNEFNLRASPGLSVRFQIGELGHVTMWLNQPNGVFELKRKEPRAGS